MTIFSAANSLHIYNILTGTKMLDDGSNDLFFFRSTRAHADDGQRIIVLCSYMMCTTHRPHIATSDEERQNTIEPTN